MCNIFLSTKNLAWHRKNMSHCDTMAHRKGQSGIIRRNEGLRSTDLTDKTDWMDDCAESKGLLRENIRAFLIHQDFAS